MDALTWVVMEHSRWYGIGGPDRGGRGEETQTRTYVVSDHHGQDCLPAV
jgi:hypothetical protein